MSNWYQVSKNRVINLDSLRKVFVEKHFYNKSTIKYLIKSGHTPVSTKVYRVVGVNDYYTNPYDKYETLTRDFPPTPEGKAEAERALNAIMSRDSDASEKYGMTET